MCQRLLNSFVVCFAVKQNFRDLRWTGSTIRTVDISQARWRCSDHKYGYNYREANICDEQQLRLRDANVH